MPEGDRAVGIDSDLRPVGAALARRYVHEGLWTDESLGRFLDEHLVRGRGLEARVWSATRPHRGTIGDVRELARRVAGGPRDRGVRAATSWRSSCPTGSRPRPRSTRWRCSARWWPRWSTSTARRSWASSSGSAEHAPS